MNKPISKTNYICLDCNKHMRISCVYGGEVICSSCGRKMMDVGTRTRVPKKNNWKQFRKYILSNEYYKKMWFGL